MAAEDITSTKLFDTISEPGCEMFKVTVTETGDWIYTKFSKIHGLSATPADAEEMGVTLSGGKITIIKATSAVINFSVWGTG